MWELHPGRAPSAPEVAGGSGRSCGSRSRRVQKQGAAGVTTDSTIHRCDATRARLKRLLEFLGSKVPSAQPDMWFTKCGACRNGKPKGCSGPRIEIRPEDPLAFTRVKVRSGKEVQLDISGIIQCGPDGRLTNADAEHCVHFRLWLFEPDMPRKLILKSHVDIANAYQHGPATHLQFGSRVVDDNWRLPSEANEIRWPVPIMDFVLAVELGLYSLWFDDWRRLVQNREFVSIIRASEDTRTAHFMETWRGYISGRASGGTFLGALCNQTSTNPLRLA